MRIPFLMLCFLTCFLMLGKSTYAQHQDTTSSYISVEQQPEFPGGTAALMKYIVNNLKLPKGFIDDELCARVIVKFVISTTGKAEQVKVVKACNNPTLEQEVIKLIENMPLWKPGKLNGKIVTCDYILPITIDHQE